MKKIKLAALFYIAAGITIYAQQFPVKTILQNGPTSQRINIVFLGDGYRQIEMTKYETDVQNTVNKLFQESPYKEYKNFFNVFAVEVPSKESGTSHPGGLDDCGAYKDSSFSHDTYFKSTFDASKIHRLLVADYGKAANVLMQNFPEYDMVFIVVNHSWYGGSGGSLSVFSTNGASAEIAIHEAGHSFAGLADEYDYGADGPISYDGINFTIQTSRALIPWKDWILASTPIPTPPTDPNIIGAIEGAYYRKTGVYRPKLNCKMRSLGIPFCEICLEQHVKTIFSYFELIDSHQPSGSSVKMYTNGKTDFSIGIIQFGLINLSVNWSLDNNMVAQNSYSYSLNGSETTIGRHNLSATVIYNTPFVRNDPQGYLQSSFNWSVDVASPTGIETGEGIPDVYSLSQNYPNPFNPQTEIKFSLPEASVASLRVYDVLGRQVATLLNEYKAPGNYTLHFDTQKYSLPSGVYFYVLTANEYSKTRKMIYLK